ncbi:MAG TPA: TIM barrel protein, partial [Gemmatimonadales bacterium]
MDRRDWLKAGGAAALGTALGAVAPAGVTARPVAGRLKQSVCRWAFGAVALPDLCKAGAAMGLAAIDLLQPADWERVRDFGLVCSMGYPADRKDFIALGFNDPAHHAQLLGELETAIPLAARRGVPNVITMFGNRGAAADAEAITNCVTGLNRIKALAEEQGVTVCVELLNSKVDHAGYQGDRTAFGVAVMR